MWNLLNFECLASIMYQNVLRIVKIDHIQQKFDKQHAQIRETARHRYLQSYLRNMKKNEFGQATHNMNKTCNTKFHEPYVSNSSTTKFYILLTAHHVMILGKWPTWRTILFYVFIFIFNSIHVSSTSCSSSGETIVSIQPLLAVGGRVLCRSEVPFRPAHGTARPPTQSDSHQRLYWRNLSLLMMSTMCSKHV